MTICESRILNCRNLFSPVSCRLFSLEYGFLNFYPTILYYDIAYDMIYQERRNIYESSAEKGRS